MIRGIALLLLISFNVSAPATDAAFRSGSRSSWTTPHENSALRRVCINCRTASDDLTLVFKMPVYSRWDNSYFFSDGSKVQRADSVLANDIKRSFGDLILAIFSG
jgi:hypothetical protein